LQQGLANLGAGPVRVRTPDPGGWVALITRQ
jgi:hypothetical protein